MGKGATKSPLPIHRYLSQTMTKKQIRDLQQFAVELAKEGNTKAAKEVLNLITNHG